MQERTRDILRHLEAEAHRFGRAEYGIVVCKRKPEGGIEWAFDDLTQGERPVPREEVVTLIDVELA